jgi:hypothetical protein
VQATQATHHHPVILCPGLGSSGAYSFDLSPNVSLADYLASRGWDVWTCELRGGHCVVLAVPLCWTCVVQFVTFGCSDGAYTLC